VKRKYQYYNALWHLAPLRKLAAIGYIAYMLYGTAGCAVDKDGVTLAEDNGVTKQKLWSWNGVEYWPNGNIPVCFQPRYNVFSGLDENGTVDYALQAIQIQTVIENAFENMEGVKINFTGWQTCPGPSVSPLNADEGQVFGGGLKIMIKCNDPTTGKIDDGGWFTDSTGYLGSTAHQALWTSQAAYSWGDNYNAAVEHEAMHALGFEHEFDRDDFDTPCPGGNGSKPGEGTGSKAADAGTRLTVYDHKSALNETYCGDGMPGLSDLDKLGLAMVYPDGSAIPVRSVSGFIGGNGLIIVRNDDLLKIDWLARGATTSVIASSPVPSWTWRPSSGQSRTLSSALQQSTSKNNLTGGTGTIEGNFYDWLGRSKQLKNTQVIASDSYHTALVMNVTRMTASTL
jgi:hypothetical protein